MYAYFTDISQGSVEMHLWCGGMHNNYIICRVCQRKNFENRSIISEDMAKNKVARFLAHPVQMNDRTKICTHKQHNRC